MKLTKPVIDGLTCPPDRKERIVFDDRMTGIGGFGVRVSKSGAKTFIFQSSPPGSERHVRTVIGVYGETWTPAKARARAAQLAREADGERAAWRAKVAAGEDPRAEREARQAAERQAQEQRRRQELAERFTLAELITRWATHALAQRSARHQAEAQRAVRVAFAGALNRPAASLTGAEVQDVIDGLVTDTPVMARRVRDYGRAAYNWAGRRRHGGIAVNPFEAAVIEAREIPRDRALTDGELGEAWRAAGALGDPMAPFIRLLILTLQRRGELAGMAWRELAQDFSTWTIPAPRAKNRKAHVVHLAEPARAILRALPRIDGGALVFPATRRRRLAGAPGDADPAAAPGVPISGFSDVKERLFRAIEAERAQANGKPRDGAPPLDWRLHDFRRTGVTALAGLGVGHHVADRILNHVHGRGAIAGVAAVYQRFEFLAEREAAMKIWADHVLRVAGELGETPGNVVPIRRR